MGLDMRLDERELKNFRVGDDIPCKIYRAGAEIVPKASINFFSLFNLLLVVLGLVRPATSRCMI